MTTKEEKFRAVWEHYYQGHLTGICGDRHDRHLVCLICNKRWYL